VRTKPSVAPESIAGAVVHEIHRVDKDQPVADVRTMEEIASGTRTSERMLMALLGSFAGLALVLSALGIYSVLAYSVAQRTREIGVRVALGAERGDVLRLVVGSGLRLAGLGITAGLVAAFLLTRLMAELLYGVRASDPATFCAVSIILAGASLAACYVPARRAARVDPMVALRHE
jgi:putative ABC transport system permease protein